MPAQSALSSVFRTFSSQAIDVSEGYRSSPVTKSPSEARTAQTFLTSVDEVDETVPDSFELPYITVQQNVPLTNAPLGESLDTLISPEFRKQLDTPQTRSRAAVSRIGSNDQKAKQIEDSLLLKAAPPETHPEIMASLATGRPTVTAATANNQRTRTGVKQKPNGRLSSTVASASDALRQKRAGDAVPLQIRNSREKLGLKPTPSRLSAALPLLPAGHSRSPPPHGQLSKVNSLRRMVPGRGLPSKLASYASSNAARDRAESTNVDRVDVLPGHSSPSQRKRQRNARKDLQAVPAGSIVKQEYTKAKANGSPRSRSKKAPKGPLKRGVAERIDDDDNYHISQVLDAVPITTGRVTRSGVTMSRSTALRSVAGGSTVNDDAKGAETLDQFEQTFIEYPEEKMDGLATNTTAGNTQKNAIELSENSESSDASVESAHEGDMAMPQSKSDALPALQDALGGQADKPTAPTLMQKASVRPVGKRTRQHETCMPMHSSPPLGAPHAGAPAEIFDAVSSVLQGRKPCKGLPKGRLPDQVSHKMAELPAKERPDETRTTADKVTKIKDCTGAERHNSHREFYTLEQSAQRAQDTTKKSPEGRSNDDLAFPAPASGGIPGRAGAIAGEMPPDMTKERLNNLLPPKRPLPSAGLAEQAQPKRQSLQHRSGHALEPIGTLLKSTSTPAKPPPYRSDGLKMVNENGSPMSTGLVTAERTTALEAFSTEYQKNHGYETQATIDDPYRQKIQRAKAESTQHTSKTPNITPHEQVILPLLSAPGLKLQPMEREQYPRGPPSLTNHRQELSSQARPKIVDKAAIKKQGISQISRPQYTGHQDVSQFVIKKVIRHVSPNEPSRDKSDPCHEDESVELNTVEVRVAPQKTTRFLDLLRLSSKRATTRSHCADLVMLDRSADSDGVGTEQYDHDQTLVAGTEHVGYDSETSSSGFEDDEMGTSPGSSTCPNRAEDIWRASLKPHQLELLEALMSISHRLVRHLVDREIASKDIVEDYCRDGHRLIETMEREQLTDLESFADAVKVAQDELIRRLDVSAGDLECTMRKVKKSRQTLQAKLKIPDVEDLHIRLGEAIKLFG